MEKLSRRQALAALGSASTVIAAGAVPAIAATTNPDAELFAALSQFEAAREASGRAAEAFNVAKRDAMSAYPDLPPKLWFMGEYRNDRTHSERCQWVMYPNRQLGYLVENHAHIFSKKELASVWRAFDRFEAACQPINEAHNLPHLAAASKAAQEEDDLAFARFVATPALTLAGLLTKLEWAQSYNDWLKPDLHLVEAFRGSGVYANPKLIDSAVSDLKRLATRDGGLS